ncbi:hypothetical protein SGFS_073070 [Streptomyces graminofaciens]|uniref:Integral membrane protein n=1 Tax=Streptomyces graminofaciens TaxID=68212 RepID=A0ABN5VU25_9ACTN|nr:hypothetical protein [Streptomyces graminofaciens]BBC36013.1 hypothetical protein SGFS_073070 [Streptomyces graminofaciens]
MPRHDVRPGKLTAGFFLALTGVLYLGDAGGAWKTPWFIAFPLVIAGLCLAGAVAFLNHAIRGHRVSRRANGQGGPEAGGVGEPGGPERATGKPGRKAEDIRPPDAGVQG